MRARCSLTGSLLESSTRQLCSIAICRRTHVLCTCRQSSQGSVQNYTASGSGSSYYIASDGSGVALVQCFCRNLLTGAQLLVYYRSAGKQRGHQSYLVVGAGL